MAPTPASTTQRRGAEPERESQGGNRSGLPQQLILDFKVRFLKFQLCLQTDFFPGCSPICFLKVVTEKNCISVCGMYLEIKANKEPPSAYHKAPYQRKYGAICAAFRRLCSTPTTENQPVLLTGDIL